MKKTFKEFYNDTTDENIKEIWKSPKTLFVFDANVLLDLYEYSDEICNTVFIQIEHIKDRVWLPYHSGIEFHRNRIGSIKKYNSNKKIFLKL